MFICRNAEGYMLKEMLGIPDLRLGMNADIVQLISSSGKCSLKFIGPKVWSSITDDIKLSTTFTFKWKLKKHLLHEKKFQL